MLDASGVIHEPGKGIKFLRLVAYNVIGSSKHLHVLYVDFSLLELWLLCLAPPAQDHEWHIHEIWAALFRISVNPARLIVLYVLRAWE